MTSGYCNISSTELVQVGCSSGSEEQLLPDAKKKLDIYEGYVITVILHGSNGFVY